MSNVRLSSLLEILRKKQFTGSLSIAIKNLVISKFYFRLGCFIWITGKGNFGEAKWRQLLNSLKSNFNDIKGQFTFQNSPDIYYYSLLQALKDVKATDKQFLKNSITNIFVEIVFDIIQYERANAEQLKYKIIDNDKLPHIVTFIKPNLVYERALLDWKEWFKAGLSCYSPNCFPLIKSLPELENKLDKNLIQLIDGQTSLRDLAIKSNLRVISLTKLLVPFISKQKINLSYLPISPNTSTATKKSTELSQYRPVGEQYLKNQVTPISSIICVDDSPLVLRDLEKIICEFSCNFLGIQDPVKAIPLIIKKSPNLIFLDLIMPIMGGYELCSRIRKIPNFKHTPIIILTGKDGIVDKFKAKLVGATDFISKSASPVKLQTLIFKYSQPIKQYRRVENRPPHCPQSHSRKRPLFNSTIPNNIHSQSAF